MEGDTHEWEQQMYGKSLYPLRSFSASAELL